MRHRIRSVAPLALAAALICAIGVRIYDERTPSNTPAPAPAPSTSTERFIPATIDLPGRWTRRSEHDGATTWHDTTSDASVTVAAVEATDVPLEKIIADVARAARVTDPSARVDAPRSVRSPDARRGDGTWFVHLVTRGPDGAPIHVTQVWHRIARSDLDAVATWTSTAPQSPLELASHVPRPVLR